MAISDAAAHKGKARAPPLAASPTGAKRKRSDWVKSDRSGKQPSPSDRYGKRKSGFQVVPKNIPADAYLGKAKRIKADLIQKAKIKQSFAKYKQRSGHQDVAAASSRSSGTSGSKSSSGSLSLARGKGKAKGKSKASDGFFEQEDPESVDAGGITDEDAQDVQQGDDEDEEMEALRSDSKEGDVAQSGRFAPQGSDDLLEQASRSALRKARARAGPPPGSGSDNEDEGDDDAESASAPSSAAKRGGRPDLRRKTPKKHVPRKDAKPAETGNARLARLEPKVWKRSEEMQRERQDAQVRRDKHNVLWNKTSTSQRGKARGQPDLGARVKVLLQRIRRDVDGADAVHGRR